MWLPLYWNHNALYCLGKKMTGRRPNSELRPVINTNFRLGKA
jgi:hypothetical protein